MKKNFLFFLGLMLIAGIFSINFDEYYRTNVDGSADINELALILSFILGIIFWVIRTIIDMGIIGITLSFVKEKKAEFSDLFAQKDRFIDFIIGSVLYGLMVVIGLILLVVPGIILAITYQYYGYFIIEKKMNAIDALKASGRITKGEKWHLFVFGIALGLTNIIGALLLGIGLLATVPTTMVAQAYVYKKLEAGDKEPAKE